MNWDRNWQGDLLVHVEKKGEYVFDEVEDGGAVERLGIAIDLHYRRRLCGSSVHSPANGLTAFQFQTFEKREQNPSNKTERDKKFVSFPLHGTYTIIH